MENIDSFILLSARMDITQVTSRAGRFKLDDRGRKLTIRNQKIFLRNKEFVLLAYFLQNVGKVVTRTEILEDVWDRNICCSTNTVDVHVSNLRQKLKRYFRKSLIKTVHCVGYIFEL